MKESNRMIEMTVAERHFHRIDRLAQQATFVDYTWKCMKKGASSWTKPVLLQCCINKAVIQTVNVEELMFRQTLFQQDVSVFCEKDRESSKEASLLIALSTRSLSWQRTLA